MGFVYDRKIVGCVCQNGTLKDSHGKCVNLTNNIIKIENKSTNFTSN
jgi:hypothetical protein